MVIFDVKMVCFFPSESIDRLASITRPKLNASITNDVLENQNIFATCGEVAPILYYHLLIWSD